MSNKQTILENNARIEAVTELLKTKNIGGGNTEVSGDLVTINRQFVESTDLRKSINGTGGYDAGLYTEEQLGYIQDELDYILRGE